MKRTVSLLLILVLVCVIAVPAAGSTLLPGMAAGTARAESYEYLDTDTGITLSIPSRWKQEDVHDDAVAKVLFTNESDDSVVIRYGSADMWSTLSEAMQKKITREEYDNEVYSEEDIAELVGTEEKYVEKVRLEGEEYFRAQVGKKQFFFFFKITSTYLIHVDNGWMFVYSFSADDSHALYKEFETIAAGVSYTAPAEELTEETLPEETLPEETVPPTTTEPVKTDADIYNEAVQAYNAGKYSTAKKHFDSISTYKDSSKYLRLIRIRDYGGNTGMGSVYYYNRALTESQKAEIDAAAEDFYFADTPAVLLCNSDVACYYLLGDWVTEAGSPVYSYLKFKKDASGGCTYYRSSNLSTLVSDCFSINDGTVRVSITSSNTPTFELCLTAPDCLEVYSCEKCTYTTLYRNN